MLGRDATEGAMGEHRRYDWTVRAAPMAFEDDGAAEAFAAAAAGTLRDDETGAFAEFLDDVALRFEVSSPSDLGAERLKALVARSVRAVVERFPKACVAATGVRFLTPWASDAVAALPADVAEYLDRAVRVVGPDCEDLSDETKAQVAKRLDPSKIGRGVACCHLRDDGELFIVAVDPVFEPKSLRHEAIHAAQVHASEEAMRAAFLAAAESGRELFAAAEKALGRAPDLSGVHRDVAWVRGACKPGNAAGAGAFGLSLSVHPNAETAALAGGIGVADGMSVVAAMHAAALLDGGFDDWTGDLAREIVAHRFQSEEHPAIDALFASAMANVSAMADAPAAR
jgi:hypothetical protein